MKIAQLFIVLGLCFFGYSCYDEDFLDIDIGDFYNQRDAWYKQNMLDYTLETDIFDATGLSEAAVITVKNGVLESCEPMSWFTIGRPSTIPEFYSFIEKKMRDMKDAHGTGKYSGQSLLVKYNREYHYPKEIVSSVNYPTSKSTDGAYATVEWTITITPTEE